ncbi:MAG: hypothetical protein WCC12_01945 [Anaerolineales bacterium]
MEAVIAILKNILKNTTVAIGLGVLLGLILGLVVGWGIWPVQWNNTTPEFLREDLQKDFLRMTIDSYNRTGDTGKAVERWNSLGESGDTIFGLIETDPGYLNPVDIQQFRAVIQSGTGVPVQPVLPPGEEPTGLGSTWAILGGVVLVIFVGAVAFYLFRLLRKNTGPMTAVMQGAELSRQVEKTDFQSLGLAPPITQTMTTYVLGDDLYDESFSIDTGGGEFLGEYGVGVSETIGVGEPKKVAALEIWLFDKNDIKTATKVLMSEHAYNDPNIRARLEPKGELVTVKPQEQVLLETATLQLLATVVDMDYGTGAMPQRSYFERITLELAIWPRSG